MVRTAPHDFLNVSDIVSAIRRGWFRIAAITMLLSGIALVALITLPNRYQSDALLYVRMGRGTVSLDPASTAAGQTISLMDRRQSEINSVREMLQSRIVLERTARSIGVERIMQLKPWWEHLLDGTEATIETLLLTSQDKLLGKRYVGNKSVPEGFTSKTYADQEEFELAVKRLASALHVGSAKDSYTLSLNVRAYDPKLAHDICESIISEYRKIHVEAHSLEGSLKFFEVEFAACEERLQNLESKLRDEKNRASMLTITGKQDLIHQEIRQLQGDRIKASSELAAAVGRDVELNSKIVAMPATVGLEKTAGVGNAATDAMRNQLFELEMLEKELTGKYSSEHPLVIQVRKKLQEAQSIYKGQSSDRTLSREAVNPVRQELELDRLRNLSALEGWKAQVQEIDEKLVQSQNKAAQLNSDELRINELERNVQLAREDVRIYGRKREEARLLKQLDSGNFSDISVPQPPTLVFKHVSPKRSLLLPACVVASLLLSCCWVIFRTPLQSSKEQSSNSDGSNDQIDGERLRHRVIAGERESALSGERTEILVHRMGTKEKETTTVVGSTPMAEAAVGVSRSDPSMISEDCADHIDRNVHKTIKLASDLSESHTGHAISAARTIH